MKNIRQKLLIKLTITAAVLLLLGNQASAADIRWEETPRVGLAIEEVSNAPLVNMAAIGTGKATGFGWSGYFNNDDSFDYTISATMGFIAYNYRNINNRSNHEIGLGIPLFKGMYMGTSFRWEREETLGFNMQMLYRPAPWMSLALKGESLNYNPWMEWGIGIRPLSFSNYWGPKLTLFYDGRVLNGGEYKNLASGIKFTPVNGLELYGHWDFREDKFVSGINLYWNRLMLGGEMTNSGSDAWKEGNMQFFLSAKDLDGFGANSNQLLFYDAAEVITDTPRLFSAATDYFPNPTPARSIYEFLTDMEKIAADKNIKAVMFSKQYFHTSFSNILEIEQALKKLKKAGKQIYFYADSYSSTQYALAASVADEIFISPQGAVDLTGFGVTNLYFKDVLAKFGINIYNFRSHDYKTAYNFLTESSMTDQEREELTYVYGALQKELDRMIMDGRSEDLTAPLDKIYSQGYWMSAAKAKKLGLVDGIKYPDQMLDWIQDSRFHPKNFTEFRWKIDYQWESVSRPNIAVIYANGNINSGDGIKGQNIGDKSLSEAIRMARYNPMVKGIVIRVNSGGGSALASDLIAREVALCSTGHNPKPVVISMGGAAASGGYMISAPAAKIMATPATITGSIGVITIVPEISGLLNKFEIGVDTVKTTDTADMASLFRPMSEKEKQMIRDSVMENYDSFISLVAESRSMDKKEVNNIAQGRIWTGKQAMERGLVDSMGSLMDAIGLVSSMTHVKNPRVIEINPGQFSFSMPGMASAIARGFGAKQENPMDVFPEDLKNVLDFYKTVSEYKRGESLYLMPYTLEELGLETPDSF